MSLTNLETLEQARKKLRDCIEKIGIKTEDVDIKEAVGRILAEDITSRENVPAFIKGMKDGYALIAADTKGATRENPVILKCVGEVLMGQAPAQVVESGQCMYITTGGMMPKGADALMMVEETEAIQQTDADERPAFGEVNIYTEAKPNQDTAFPGEDIKIGDVIIKKGKKLTAQDVAAMGSLGFAQAKVYEKPTIYIISTGDEILPVTETPKPGQTRDINSYGVMGLAQEYGFKILDMKLLADDEQLLKNTTAKAMQLADIVVLSGGSSKGKKDVTAKIIDEISTPGVLVHGISIKPGKPTIIGLDEVSKTLMIGLPGHPSSALMLFRLTLAHMYYEVMGVNERPCISAVAQMDIKSTPGKALAKTVNLVYEDGDVKAIPVKGKFGAITTLSKADGYVLIDTDEEGIEAGCRVMVYPF